MRAPTGRQAWLDRLAERDPRVRVHRNATNIGALANCRRFFELAEAEFSMFLCSDDRLAAPDALASALAVMHREPGRRRRLLRPALYRWRRAYTR